MKKVNVRKLLDKFELDIVRTEMPLKLEVKEDSTLVLHIGNSSIIYPPNDLNLSIKEACLFLDRLKLEFELNILDAVQSFLETHQLQLH